MIANPYIAGDPVRPEICALNLVNGTDWADNYGYGAGGAPVPVPATLLVLAAGAAAVICRRRRS